MAAPEPQVSPSRGARDVDGSFARDAGRLTGRAAAGVARVAQRTQAAVTDQVYARLDSEGPLGAVVRPVRAAQEGLTRGVYGAVRLGLMGAGLLGGEISARRGIVLRDEVQTRLVRSLLNGLVGDRLAADESALALSMTVRQDGRDVPTTAQDLGRAFGSRGQQPRSVTVFVHGLVEHEDTWSYRAGHFHADPGMSLPTRLARDHGCVPVLLTYNTGLSIRENGAYLDRLLTDLVAEWPGGIEELALVGHSMGGLVIACALTRADRSWAAVLTRVVTLGSPCEGAPLERAVAALERASGRVPTTLWLADILGVRSRGITDLGGPGDQLAATGGVRSLVVYGALAPWRAAGTDRLGDGLVPVPTAQAPGRTASAPGKTPVEQVVQVGVSHQGLLNHPAVHELVSGWWDGPGAAAGAP